MFAQVSNKTPALERLYSRTRRAPGDLCWVWEGARTQDGYGKIKMGGKVFRAHRLSYFLHTGELEEGKMICHTCANRLCVNPGHLYQGDEHTNAKDARQMRVKAEVWGIVEELANRTE